VREEVPKNLRISLFIIGAPPSRALLRMTEGFFAALRMTDPPLCHPTKDLAVPYLRFFPFGRLRARLSQRMTACSDREKFPAASKKIKSIPVISRGKLKN
jgi:hypothetical protein